MFFTSHVEPKLDYHVKAKLMSPFNIVVGNILFNRLSIGHYMVDEGVPQGSILGLLVFTVYINCNIRFYTGNNIMFASLFYNLQTFYRFKLVLKSNRTKSCCCLNSGEVGFACVASTTLKQLDTISLIVLLLYVYTICIFYRVHEVALSCFDVAHNDIDRRK